MIPGAIRPSSVRVSYQADNFPTFIGIAKNDNMFRFQTRAVYVEKASRSLEAIADGSNVVLMIVFTVRDICRIGHSCNLVATSPSRSIL